MEYTEQDCLRDLLGVRDGTASEDDEAALTFSLLSVLGDRGTTGIIDLIQSLDQAKLGEVAITRKGDDVIIRITRSGSDSLVVSAGDDTISPWVDVQIDSSADPVASEDPRHVAFYAIWERFVRSELSYSEEISDEEKAVYLMATLESEVMNGGFGQYLTNTEGLLLPHTLDCLERIGATKTRALLASAVELSIGHDSYAAAWDEQSEKYAGLDDEFSEDLAGLTAIGLGL